MTVEDRLRRGVASMARSNKIPPPVQARHAEWSAIASLDDQPGAATDSLIRTCMEAVAAALEVELGEVAADLGPEDRAYLETWPGEHYRLLAGFVRSLGVKRAVEIGTFRGVGARCLHRAGADVTTFDVLPPSQIGGSLVDGYGTGIDARVGDLADDATWRRNEDALESAQLIFLDGPKDGVFEPRILRRLVPLIERNGAVLIIDDIRVLPMLQTWRDLSIPKLDMTSFGHWSGTGVARAD